MTSHTFPEFDTNIPDIYRVQLWKQDFEKNGPANLNMMWLSSDHTGGTPNARAQVADSDLSTGQIVDTISHFRHDSGCLMTADEGFVHGPVARHEMQVGMAHSHGLDVDGEFASGNTAEGQSFDGERLTGSAQHRGMCVHVSTLNRRVVHQFCGHRLAARTESSS